jgi:hypothetical protein
MEKSIRLALPESLKSAGGFFAPNALNNRLSEWKENFTNLRLIGLVL